MLSHLQLRRLINNFKKLQFVYILENGFNLIHRHFPLVFMENYLVFLGNKSTVSFLQRINHGGWYK